MQRTNIEYLTHTWNPFSMRCTPVSEGCAHCWHLRMANRLRVYYKKMPSERTNCYAKYQAYNGGYPWLNAKELAAPLSKKKPAVIGVQFMGDLFHESLSSEQIAAVFGVMAATPQHQYVVLTKRLQRALEWFDAIAQKYLPWINMFARVISMSEPIINIRSYFQPGYMGKRIGETSIEWPLWPLHNAIICASVENQPTTYERVSLLLQIPARWHGVSVEPMLSSIELQRNRGWLSPFKETDAMLRRTPRLDIAICGAETGPGKRPFKDEWALDLRDQCKAAGTPFFFKKDGNGNGTLCGVEYHEWVK